MKTHEKHFITSLTAGWYANTGVHFVAVPIMDRSYLRISMFYQYATMMGKEGPLLYD